MIALLSLSVAMLFGLCELDLEDAKAIEAFREFGWAAAFTDTGLEDDGPLPAQCSSCLLGFRVSAGADIMRAERR